MKLIESEIWLEIEEITEGCNITDRTIRLGIERGSSLWQVIKDPADRRRTLVRYATLADKYKKGIIYNLCDGLEPLAWYNSKLPSPSGEGLGAAVGTVRLEDRLTQAFEHDYVQYLNLYKPETQDEVKRQRQRRDLARAAAFIIALAKHYEETNTPLSKYNFYNEAAKFLTTNANLRAYGRRNNAGSKLSISYLPTHPTRIAEKVKDYLCNDKPISEVISQPRSGNENRLGENHTFAKGAVARLLQEGKNPTDAAMVRKVQYLCTKEGLAQPSESTIRRMVADLQALTALKRYGEANKAAHKYRFTTPLARAMYAGDCWEMDGTRVQLQPHLTDGKLMYLYVVAVRDVYSGAYLGWSFGINESGLMYREALRMAVTLTGYLPYEIKHDKFPGHDSKEIENLFKLFTERGVRMTVTSSKTGKAHAERAFGTLQSVFEMDRKEWVGQGIKSSRHYNRPTAEYLLKTQKQLRADGWTWEEAWRAENEVIMLYNHAPLNFYSKKYKNITQSPIELHDTETVRKNIKQVEIWDVAELFWATRAEDIRNYQIKFKVNRIDYILDLVGAEYYHITRNYREVNIRFDAADMSEVMIFDIITNQHLATVKPFTEIQLFGAEPEYGRLQERKAKVKAQKELMKAELQTITESCKEDVLSLSLASILPKDVVEAAESSAMANYWRNTVPIQQPTINPKNKPSPKAKQVVALASGSGDTMFDILNQL